MYSTFAFYFLSTASISAAFLTVASNNAVRSVIWLIFTFFSVACIFVLLNAEFVAMMLLIVYVGAVAVLFLFVVMMLNLEVSRVRSGLFRYSPLGLLIAVVLLMQVGITLTARDHQVVPGSAFPFASGIGVRTNTQELGTLIYTKYVLLFQVAGLILIVAMIGAIVLTFRTRKGIKRQSIPSQIYRDPVSAIELRDVGSGDRV